MTTRAAPPGVRSPGRVDEPVEAEGVCLPPCNPRSLKAVQLLAILGVVTTSSGSNSVVECQLPKLDVAGSSPVSRSIFLTLP